MTKQMLSRAGDQSLEMLNDTTASSPEGLRDPQFTSVLPLPPLSEEQPVHENGRNGVDPKGVAKTKSKVLNKRLRWDRKAILSLVRKEMQLKANALFAQARVKRPPEIEYHGLADDVHVEYIGQPSTVPIQQELRLVEGESGGREPSALRLKEADLDLQADSSGPIPVCEQTLRCQSQSGVGGGQCSGVGRDVLDGEGLVGQGSGHEQRDRTEEIEGEEVEEAMRKTQGNRERVVEDFGKISEI